MSLLLSFGCAGSVANMNTGIGNDINIALRKGMDRHFTHKLLIKYQIRPGSIDFGGKPSM